MLLIKEFNVPIKRARIKVESHIKVNDRKIDITDDKTRLSRSTIADEMWC